MNIIKRTCATCAAFNPSATNDEVVCANLVSFTKRHCAPQAARRSPRSADRCDSHQTHERLVLVHGLKLAFLGELFSRLKRTLLLRNKKGTPSAFPALRVAGARIHSFSNRMGLLLVLKK